MRFGFFFFKKKDGSWPQEAIEGVFNKNVAIAYPNFKFSFTIWMLGRAHWYLQELKGKKKAGNGNGIGNGNGNGHAIVNGHANGHSGAAANGLRHR